MISFKNKCVFIHDLGDLILQIIFDAWWASKNVCLKCPIAWNRSRHASLWRFDLHCRIEETSVAGKSVSHHHHHSAWQRTELWRVYGHTGMTDMDWATGADRDTGMTEMDWVMGADGDTGVTEMDGGTGSIYWGNPRVDRGGLHLVSHLIPSYHTTNYTLHFSHLLISLALAETLCGSTQLGGSLQPGCIITSYPLPTPLEPELVFLTNSCWKATRGASECDNGLSGF